MTIAKALKLYPAKIESDILLAHVLGQPKEFLYREADKELSKLQLGKFNTLVKKRMDGMPVAYLIGYKYFYGLKFLVNRSVLIPRPESEWLVDQALKNASKSSRILDVGTGSGCLAISAAKNIKNAKITAVDISAPALTVAKHNARLNKAKVKFIQSNLLSKVSGKFDIILANLPYVPVTDYEKLYAGLRFEPKLALTDGTNQFVLIEKLLKLAAKHLSAEGIILLEIDPKGKPFISKLVKNLFPARQVKFYTDIRGLTRFAEIK